MSNKYSAEDLKDMVAKGKAMKNANGDPSYPVADKEDIEKAIHAVGRGGADHDAIRLHIINGAEKLGLSDLIPDNWDKSDGSLKEANAAEPEETRAPCSLCNGTKKVPNGDECPACKGSGQERKASRKRTQSLAERRSALHRGYEQRTFSWNPGDAARVLGLQVRSGGPGTPVDADNVAQLVGYAIRYGAQNDVHDRFGTFSEEMRSGACTQTLADGDDCVFLYDHAGLVMARRSSGTLGLREDQQGLGIEANLDTRQTLARDLAIAIERGDVHQMSVGFSVPDGGDQWNSAGDVRKINAIRLFDVSAVGIPASPTTSISLASDDTRSAIEDHATRCLALIDLVETREGKVLSSANAASLAEAKAAIVSLHDADDGPLPNIVYALQAIDASLDQAMKAISDIEDLANPDGDAEDLEPALDPPSSDDDDESRKRQLQAIILRRKRLALSNAAA